MTRVHEAEPSPGPGRRPPGKAALGRAVLLGNPNSGKTTLFNALTGLRQRIGNYPGVTVERKTGTILYPDGGEIELLDLPGTYSLRPGSPEEEIAVGVLSGRKGESPDVVVCVVDASNLERHLYLVRQLLESPRPVVVALNMMDAAESAGRAPDASLLGKLLGVPVVPMAASRGRGIEELKEAIRHAFGLQRSPLPLELPPEAEREVEARYDWIRNVCAQAVGRPGPGRSRWSDRADFILTHRVWGAVVFLAVMGLMFQSIFTWAVHPMEAVRWFFDMLGRQVTAILPPGDLRSLIVDGGLGGVAAVVTFLPQIMFLFLFLALLEDSGYMARAALMMERIMGRVGLHGRSFIPLLSSFACAIPGIMAARTIANSRDRLVTMLVAPLVTCSARLPVFTLLVAAFIPDTRLAGFLSVPALTMMALYAAGLVAALTTALLFKKTLFRSRAPAFIIELPPFRRPALRSVLLQMWERALLFLKGAGTVILGVSILLWFLSAYPRKEGASPAEQLRGSYAGMAGSVIEPAISPLGFDWKIGVGLVTSLLQREIFVSTMGTIYNVQDGDDTRVSLEEKMRRDTDPRTGKPVFTLLTAICLMVYYVLAMQCMSTLAVLRRETGGWKWPAFQFAYMSGLAYGVTFLVYRAGLMLGLGA
ncbi:MAG: ferrous iron transporter B [Bacteroidota bacterium]